MRIDEFGEILTPDDLLKILPIGRNSLYNLLRLGDIKSIRCGGKYLVTKEELLRYLGLDNKHS